MYQMPTTSQLSGNVTVSVFCKINFSIFNVLMSLVSFLCSHNYLRTVITSYGPLTLPNFLTFIKIKYNETLLIDVLI